MADLNVDELLNDGKASKKIGWETEVTFHFAKRPRP